MAILAFMKSTGFIARRYLFSKKSISLISTLTGISVTGVTIGTAVLIIVLSVFNGFFEVIKGLLLNNDPHIRIESAEGDAFYFTGELREELKSIPQIKAISPYVSGKALLTVSKNRNRVVTVKGIAVSSYKEMTKLDENITQGSLNLSVQNHKPGILVSNRLKTQMGLREGATVALLSAEGMQHALTQFTVPRTARLEVRGFYDITQIVDVPPVYTSMQAAQRLFKQRGTVTGVELRLKNSEQAAAVQAVLQQKLGGQYKIATWYELKKPMYDVMRLEKWAAYLILMIIVLVAVLNIVGSLTMIVIQKNRDIGVLLTMGYTPDDVKKIFLKQGLFIGLIGCVLGGALGLILSWLQKVYGLVELSGSFIISAYPVSIQTGDVALILAGSLLLCVLASWYPAKRAASVEPADAVRFDWFFLVRLLDPVRPPAD